MNIRPLLIEFTGTPEAGKTTTLRMLQDSLIAEGLKVEIIRESAEIVPAEIPKGDFDYTRYTRFVTLSKIIHAKHTDNDIILIDRGYWDGQLFAYHQFANNECTKQQLDDFLNVFSDITLSPDLLIAFFCDAKVALERRGGPGHVVTEDFINNYNMIMSTFISKIVSTPYSTIDTSFLSITEVVQQMKKRIYSCFVDYFAQNFKNVL